MNTSSLKKTLLAGTALVAVGAYMPMPINQAQAADLTLTANGTWALTGDPNGAAAAVVYDNIDVDTHTLTITPMPLANDNGGVGNYFVGNITDTDTGGAGTGSVDIITTAAGPDMTVSIQSVSIAGALDVVNSDAHDGSITVTVNGDVAVGSLNVQNTDTNSAKQVSLTVNGDIVVSGVATVHASDGAANNGHAALSLKGDATFTGGLVLQNAPGGYDAYFVMNGVSAQVITGNIGPQTAGDGIITTFNSSANGVTFNGNVGAVGAEIGQIVVNGTNDQSVTFAGNVATQNGIILGDNSGAETKTVNFGGAGDTTINGVVTGGASETVNVNIIGGNTVTQESGVWTGIDNLTVSANSTLLSQSDITATSTSISAGSTLNINNTSATAITGNVTAQGTLTVSAAATIDGAITNSITGVLNILADTTVTSHIVGSGGLGGINVGAGATLTAGGVVQADTTLNALSILQMTSGYTYTGNLLSGGAGEGTLHIIDGGAATAAISILGNIGTSTNHLTAISIDDHADTVILNAYGDLFVNQITLGQNDALRLLRSGGTQTVSAIVTAATGGAGIVVGDGGVPQRPTVIFNGVIGGSGNIETLTVNDGSTAIFNNNATFAGVLSSDAATIQVSEGSTLTVDTQTDADVMTWNIGVNNTGGTQTHGSVVITTGNVDLTNDTVNFIVSAGSDPLIAGASILDNVFMGGAAADYAGVTITDNSFFYDFEIVGDTNNVDFTIVQSVSLAEVSENNNNATIGDVLLNELAGSTDTQINQIQANLGAAGNAKEFNDILEASGPTVDGGAVAGVMAMANGALNITKKRLASRRTDSQSGISTGNLSEGTQIWMQAYGASGSQNRRGGIDGFDINGRGLAFGIDTQNLSDDTVVGLAFSYGNANVDSANANNTNTSIKSSQLTLYGDHDIDESTYISARLAYAWNDIDAIRYDVGGVAGLNARGSFNANQFSARAEVGRSYDYEGTTITPSLMANYAHFALDNYTETGAGGANLSVATDDIEIFELGIAVDISHDYQQDDGSILTPALHIAYRHDFIGDTAVMNSSFAAGGSTFRTVGFSPAQDTLDVGVSVTYAQANNWQLTANYNFEYKSDYEAHSGSVRAAYKF